MAQKVNGYNHGSRQNLTGGLDFYTIYTTANITATGVRKYVSGTLLSNYRDQLDLTDAATKSQYNLDKLIEVLSSRGQPVFISGVTSGATVPATVTDFTPASGATVYSIQFAIEHNMAWDVISDAADAANPLNVGTLNAGGRPVFNPTLAETLNGIGDFVYTGVSGAATNTLTVVKNGSYSNDFNVNVTPVTAEDLTVKVNS